MAILAEVQAALEARRDALVAEGRDAFVVSQREAVCVHTKQDGTHMHILYDQDGAALAEVTNRHGKLTAARIAALVGDVKPE